MLGSTSINTCSCSCGLGDLQSQNIHRTFWSSSLSKNSGPLWTLNISGCGSNPTPQPWQTSLLVHLVHVHWSTRIPIGLPGLTHCQVYSHELLLQICIKRGSWGLGQTSCRNSQNEQAFGVGSVLQTCLWIDMF